MMDRKEHSLGGVTGAEKFLPEGRKRLRDLYVCVPLPPVALSFSPILIWPSVFAVTSFSRPGFVFSDQFHQVVRTP
jgi:hypothetical protein